MADDMEEREQRQELRQRHIVGRKSVGRRSIMSVASASPITPVTNARRFSTASPNTNMGPRSSVVHVDSAGFVVHLD